MVFSKAYLWVDSTDTAKVELMADSMDKSKAFRSAERMVVLLAALMVDKMVH